MAFEHNTATDYADLMDRLVTFATAHGWTLTEDSRGLGISGYVILQGSGAGSDAIYVGVAKNVLADIDVYGLVFQGYAAYVNGTGFNNQPGAITSRLPGLPLWNSTIPYWFFVTPSRIKIVAKVSTVYVHAYLGYPLIYGSPGQWPYPLIVSGSNITDTFLNLPRYSDISGQMIMPYIGMSGGGADSTLIIRTAAGTWLRILNNINTKLGIGDPTSFNNVYSGVWPFVENLAEAASGSFFGFGRLVPSQSGDYPLYPLRILHDVDPDTFGIFDDVRFTTGVSLSSEDTIVDENTATWIVFQDTFRTTTNSFIAIKQA